MATRKKPAESTQADNDLEQAKAELAELEASFYKRLKSAVSFDAGLQWVDCDLADYQGVRVLYNTENRYEMGILFALERPIRNIPLADRLRLYSLFVRSVEWPFDLPSPTPDDLTTYEPLIYQFSSLLRWIRNEGYVKAKEEFLKNSLNRSVQTSKNESGNDSDKSE